jgi:uncharacterized protein CbrC (UPF0167 family)
MKTDYALPMLQEREDWAHACATQLITRFVHEGLVVLTEGCTGLEAILHDCLADTRLCLETGAGAARIRRTTERIVALLMDDDRVEDIFGEIEDFEPVVRRAFESCMGTQTAAAANSPESNALYDRPEDFVIATADRCEDCGEHRTEFVDVGVRRCLACFQAGRCQPRAVDTEYGLVDPQCGSTRLTDGVPPGLEIDLATNDQFEVIRSNASNRVRLTQAAFDQLVRTPRYASSAGECWLFCCNVPMVVAKILDRYGVEEMLDAETDEHRACAEFRRLVGSPDETGDYLRFRSSPDATFYLFHCGQCARQRAYWDR